MEQNNDTQQTTGRKPVWLAFEDIVWHKLTAAETRELYSRFHERRQQFKAGHGDGPDTESLDAFDIDNTQQLLREALQLVRPRVDDVDYDNLFILSPEGYLDAIEGMDTMQKAMFNKTIAEIVTIPMENGRQVSVDKGLAPYLQRMANIGIATGQSDSGMLRDHPNYRYVADDKHGRYVKGECINYGKQGSGAYLTFWKPEAENIARLSHAVNTQQQIDMIRAEAGALGWECLDTTIFNEPSLRIAPPYTYDGSHRQAVIHEANLETDRRFPGLKRNGFSDWLEKRSGVLIDVEKSHGGVIPYTDRMIQERWEQLTQGLERGMRQIQQQSGGRHAPYPRRHGPGPTTAPWPRSPSAPSLRVTGTRPVSPVRPGIT